MGRQARGVRGMQLDEAARVIALLVAEDEQQNVLTATEPTATASARRSPSTRATAAAPRA